MGCEKLWPAQACRLTVIALARMTASTGLDGVNYPLPSNAEREYHDAVLVSSTITLGQANYDGSTGAYRWQRESQVPPENDSGPGVQAEALRAASGSWERQ